ncbi:ABC-type transport system substrate-binding protein [Rhizobium sp. 1399]|jgi:ABC-type transport system substrate-binding protein|nr:ABC-type transport system substrate-binding protein [Rhizobium sp. 1399]
MPVTAIACTTPRDPREVRFTPSAKNRIQITLLHGTNAQEIVTTLFSDHYPQAKSIIASAAQGYVDLSSKLNYDPEQAAKLLDQAGWKLGADGQREKDGQKLVLTAYESLPQPQNKATLRLVAQQRAKLGVTLNVLAGDAGNKTLDDLDPAKKPDSWLECSRIKRKKRSRLPSDAHLRNGFAAYKADIRRATCLKTSHRTR